MNAKLQNHLTENILRLGSLESTFIHFDLKKLEKDNAHEIWDCVTCISLQFKNTMKCPRVIVN